MPGERGLLAVADWPQADAPRRDEAAEAEVERLIEAVTALRRYRDEVGASRRRACAGAWWPTATTGSASQLGAPGPLRAGRRRRATATCWPPCRSPAAASQVLPSDAFDPAEAEKRIAARREQLEAEIERAERKLANEKFVERAPAEVVEEERRKLEEYREALRAPRGDELPPGRGVPALARAVRHALRARPHAPADDRARPAAAPLRLDPRGGHQRQVVDGALLRRDPRAPRAAQRAATPRRT